jgi:hypothetical protein
MELKGSLRPSKEYGYRGNNACSKYSGEIYVSEKLEKPYRKIEYQSLHCTVNPLAKT